MRADKLIILSKGFTERCMLKFLNYFVNDSGGTDQLSMGACSGNSTANVKKLTSSVNRDQSKSTERAMKDSCSKAP